jgi:protoheme IX farnesyltransferase
MSLVADTEFRAVDAPEFSAAEVGDFFALLKPRVMFLVLVTALAGILAAPGPVHPVIALVALFCIAVGAGAAGALNMWWDADIDAVMERTRLRPVPSGRVLPGEACFFGGALALASVVMLGLFTNVLAGAMLAFTIFFYVVIYTMWLKRATPQNIVIGGLAGAFPPLVGWVAVTGSIAVPPLVLVAIIFMWTPPHFWALALIRSGDYARAGVPMLPVVRGPSVTRLHILVYSILLAPLGVVPYFMGFAGPVYGVVAAVGGALFLQLAVRVYRLREGEPAARAAGQLFGFSILYLLVLFAVLIAEHGLGLAW